MSQWIKPVNGRITTPFGVRGGNWSSGRHTGVDYAMPQGTLIKTVDDGVVIPHPYHARYGNYIDVNHGGGIVTRYAHMSKKKVFAGRVAQGQVIGFVGATGNTTGNHLHFEVIKNGTAVNPVPFLDGSREIPDDPDDPQDLPDTGPDISNITSPDTWIRVASFIGGSLIIGIALWLFWNQL